MADEQVTPAFEPRVLGDAGGPAVGVRVADATDTSRPATTSTRKPTVVLTLNDGDSGDVHLALADDEVAWVARALGAARAATHRAPPAEVEAVSWGFVVALYTMGSFHGWATDTLSTEEEARTFVADPPEVWAPRPQDALVIFELTVVDR